MRSQPEVRDIALVIPARLDVGVEDHITVTIPEETVHLRRDINQLKTLHPPDLEEGEIRGIAKWEERD